MPAVTSADGTAIAYEKNGAGPALVVVDGALTTRTSSSKAELIALLSPRLTVYTYDRRGRGDSGDTPPYAVAREIEDLDAVIEEAGGSAALYGHSSGACLALDAAVAFGGRVGKLAMYEAAGVLGTDRSVPQRAARVAVPTLVMHGSAGAPFMAETARVLQKAIAGAELRALAGQGHNVSPEALAPVLAEFVTR